MKIKLPFLLALILFSFTQSIAQIQKGRDLNGEAANDHAGASVCMPNAETIAIGAFYNDGGGFLSGHTRIYSWNGSMWIKKGMDIDGEKAYEYSGSSVSMPNPNVIAIGSSDILTLNVGVDVGKVKVYGWNGLAWLQIGSTFYGDSTSGAFRNSVSMPDSSTIAIRDLGNKYVKVYKYNDVTSDWVQKGGKVLDGENSYYSNSSISMPDANTLAIGSYHSRHNFRDSDTGFVRIFSWNGAAWIQKGGNINGLAKFGHFGYSVSMPDSNTITIGDPLRNCVKVYKWTGTDWIQKGGDIDELMSTRFGHSVSMPDSNFIAIGAPSHNGAKDLTRIYRWNGTKWMQQGIDIIGELINDRSGSSVSMPDTNTFAIGAPFNDGNGISSGHARVYVFCDIRDTIIPSTCFTSFRSRSGKYIWRESGTYNDTIPISKGCDSILTYILKIGKVSSSDSSIAACNRYTSPSGRYNWTASGTYMDTIPNKSGCDSIITINLSIIKNSSSTFSITRCNNYTSPSGKYNWTASGIYKDTITNANGCDSIITVDLSIENSTSSISIATCISYTSPSGKYIWKTSGTYLDTLPNTSGCDSIITINLTINSTESNIAPTVCTAYTSPSGKYNWTASGKYKDTVPNANGCDSVITISLTNNSFNVKLVNSNNSLIANPSSAKYQWINCDNKYSLIANEINQRFTPAIYGNYAAIVYKNGCIDTSACVLVGDIENACKQSKVYPNPTNGIVTIQLVSNNLNGKIKINDVDGRLVYQKSNINTNQVVIDFSTFSKGIYFLNIQNKDCSKTIRVARM